MANERAGKFIDFQAECAASIPLSAPEAISMT
jgi:hypothetical protein